MIMDYLRFVLPQLVVIIASLYLTVSSTLQIQPSQTDTELSFCQSEYFKVKCQEDEVIVITQAHYGRMRESKCVKQNFGYVGCSADVVDIMNRKCSGRRSCTVRVLDDNFNNLKPCHDDLKSYLGVQYECIKVVTLDRAACQVMKPILVNRQAGFLASSVSTDSGCGSSDSPWLLKLLPGQKINITLMDFSLAEQNRTLSDHIDPTTNQILAAGKGLRGVEKVSDITGGKIEPIESSTVAAQDKINTRNNSGGTNTPNLNLNRNEILGSESSQMGITQGQPMMCRVYAIIREPGGPPSRTVCGGVSRVRPGVYVTGGETVEIRLISGKHVDNNVNFILKFEALGCANPQDPSGGWTRREGDVADFGCTDSPDTWQLKCVGNTWVGEKKNCTGAERISGIDYDNSASVALPLGFSLIIIISLALAIGLIILAIGVICLKRMRGDGLSDLYGRPAPCFTLGCQTNSVVRGYSAPVHQTKLSFAKGDLRPLPPHLHTTTFAHRVRSYGGPPASTYACMKLLESSPERDQSTHYTCSAASSLEQGVERGEERTLLDPGALYAERSRVGAHGVQLLDVSLCNGSSPDCTAHCNCDAKNDVEHGVVPTQYNRLSCCANRSEYTEGVNAHAHCDRLSGEERVSYGRGDDVLYTCAMHRTILSTLDQQERRHVDEARAAEENSGDSCGNAMPCVTDSF